MQGLGKIGVKVSPFGGNKFRAVTHRMILSSDIDEVIERIEKVCNENCIK